MPQREAERQAWREYYINVSQYERWRDLQGMSSSLVRNIEHRVRRITDVEDYAYLQEVISTAKKLNALVREHAGRYCAMKPEKPLGRSYGFDL